ncbi:MAG: phospho-N-acetylmuramoyl-pentapeptide-transferase [Lentimicrobiaceae bacterium]|jgi:phospho-N-acetylmuramoyl-pentapeptide-transferase|nr:phospho-N-acetylmuramoyl-pentapeptide-transferase [Lentimicrobiaceae bacterium]MCP4909316.1 phospho-N-acetylmuramoyl-pentapeptide-transferase [Bacteroidota bacterium]MBT3454978.1 phospho-N-acetylmuramoyl-pentapeptide-transferase [Lentimicrobiaceae bacterium]MBT3818396.1 phospho-N-acetylmuramoyl-pentapeptide-transferase [Lentimicrobiaceae bacterium]MBT4060764.1 phospho-N-acetylmuramoyl-pentapeptide-transferase [Lentimicrobiaceae bacterium]
MLYYLFKYLDAAFNFPGAGVFEYLSFRAAMAIITSLIISLFFGRRWISFLNKRQVGETIRDLGLEGQLEKQGTPTMGGLIILTSILVPVILFAKLENIYILLMIFTTVWLGGIGFADDYIKVFKKNKQGLKGKYKVIGQVILGLIVGLVMYFNTDIVVREKAPVESQIVTTIGETQTTSKFSITEERSTKTTIPFVKNNEFEYSRLLSWLGSGYKKWAFLIFIPIVIFIIVAVSNGANLTDGMDGLATGTSAVIGLTLGLLAWVSGNIIFADYLNIMYLPNAGELTIFISAFVGATVGFLWYNTYPAQVFMGDTGSLAIGGIIAVFAIIIRKELLIPILCGIFLAESLSVIIQVTYFKHTRKKYGEGIRVFKMSPLHHHFQKLGYPEPKIVQRFLIVGIFLAVLTIITLKLR